jgi:hypothetical protein
MALWTVERHFESEWLHIGPRFGSFGIALDFNQIQFVVVLKFAMTSCERLSWALPVGLTAARRVYSMDIAILDRLGKAQYLPSFVPFMTHFGLLCVVYCVLGFFFTSIFVISDDHVAPDGGKQWNRVI